MVFTRDLRIDDNPALVAALQAQNTSFLFVFDQQILMSGDYSAKKLQFLDEAISDLSKSLASLGGDLTVRKGRWLEEVKAHVTHVNAAELHIAKDHSNYARRRLTDLNTWCGSQSIALHSHPGITAVEPGQLQPAGGGEYKVFTPFWKAWLKAPKRTPLAAPCAIKKPLRDIPSDLITQDPTAPKGGESFGTRQLMTWLEDSVKSYEDTRDFPSQNTTSLLSPYLHFGCISPLRVLALANNRQGSEAFIRQLAWREFFTQILAKRPDASVVDYRDRGYQWTYNKKQFDAWCSGYTGVPLVDAGMRQLNQQGLLHNRIRMVVASFLVKNLHHDWRLGSSYFMSQLIDGDIASNSLNWQWVAGTGTGNNPHRVLNPTTQAKRFDRTGKYIRTWIPELSELQPNDAIDPSNSIRRKVGYPEPIVDHHQSVKAFKQNATKNNEQKSFYFPNDAS
ncbi:MAG TPA: deoxyribodipyrimidine photolyase [Acidimicrobiaceae bacterium]|nr:deoxyribodipyrimidine photolyase [Acidimicrobiaceae bacterium]